MTFKPETGIRYDMPMGFGPSSAPPVTRGLDALMASVSFVTDGDAVDALLPRWFVPATQPSITVSWLELKNVDWMGGRSYSAVAIYAAVDYQPKDLTGRYGLAIWESDSAPVIIGREYMGMPKLYGEVTSGLDVSAAENSFTCAEYGNTLLRAKLGSMTSVSDDGITEITEAGRNRSTFTWKYIPSCHGAPDADYAIRNTVSYPWHTAWIGTSEEIEFFRPSDQAAPYSGKIVRTLADLPIHEMLPSLSAKCTGGTINRDQSERLT